MLVPALLELPQSAAGDLAFGRMIHPGPEAPGNLQTGEAGWELRRRLLTISSFDFKPIMTGRRLWPFDERCE
jgi:hypothetical protein